MQSVLAAIAGAGVKRPRAAIVIALLVLAVCGYLAHDLPVSTSRYKLVSPDNPFQARLLSFFDRYGYPDALIVVVSGADVPTRQRVVNELSERYEQVPELKGRVLGRVDVDDVAELVFLFEADALSNMRKRFDEDPATLIEGGLPAWVDAMREPLDAAIDGTSTASSTEKEANQGFLDLASILNALETKLAGGDALSELPGIDENLKVPRGASVDDRGYLVSEGGDYHLIALFPELQGAEGYQVKPMVDKIREIRDQVELGGSQARVTGLPALVADELVIVKRGIAQTSLATTAGIIILLLLAFRSFRYTILSLLPLGVGIVLTLAGVRGLFGGLNLVTSSFISVLLALGIDFGVYVLSRYGELVREGRSTHEAILGSFSKAGPGMLMGAATTMLAFLMTTTIEFTAYSELGVITAVGLALMLLVTFLLLPALILLAGRGGKIKSPELAGVKRLPGLIRSGKLAFPVAALLLAGVTPFFISGITFNARYFDFLPDDTESAGALRSIETDKQLSPVQASTGVDGVEEARELAAKLRALPSVGAVQTATDVLPVLDDTKVAALRAGFEGLRDPSFDKLRKRQRSTKALADKVEQLDDSLDEIAKQIRETTGKTEAIGKAQDAAKKLLEQLEKLPDDSPALAEAEIDLANILERAWHTAKKVAERGHYEPVDLPSVFRARFMSKDGKGLAVYANPRGTIWDKDTAERFAAEVSSVDPAIAGLAVSIHEHMRMIREGFWKTSLLSAVLVFVVLLIGFRNLHDALFALFPVAIGVCWMLGLMGIIGLDFDVANVVALPLITGIGVDAGAHMMHRWRESAKKRGGVADLDDMIRGTGAAVVMASCTTATGFAALMLGDYGGMKTLGLSMSIGVTACLISSVIILPSLLVALKKAK